MVDDADENNKRVKYSNVKFINHSQYIIREMVELMCFLDCNQYSFLSLKNVDRLVAYSVMLKQISSEGESSSVMPKSSKENVSSSLKDVFIGLMLQHLSAKTYIDERQSNLIDLNQLSIKAVKMLICGAITNRQFISYSKSLIVKYFKSNDGKPLTKFNSEPDRNPNAFEAMKDMMGNMIFPLHFYLNYMRSYLITCKIKKLSFVNDSCFSDVFNATMTSLNPSDVKSAQDFLDRTIKATLS